MSISDESSSAQSGNKLEKSLDAVAALRKAMELRLAMAKAEAEHRVQIEAETKHAVIEVSPPLPPEPVLHAPALTDDEPLVTTDLTKSEITMELTPRGTGSTDQGEHANPFFTPGLPTVEASTAPAQAQADKPAALILGHDATLHLIPCTGGACDPDMTANPFYEPELPTMCSPEPKPVSAPQPQPIAVSAPIELATPVAPVAEEPQTPSIKVDDTVVFLTPRGQGATNPSEHANPFYVPELPTVPAYVAPEPPPQPQAKIQPETPPQPQPAPVIMTSPVPPVTPAPEAKPAPKDEAPKADAKTEKAAKPEAPTDDHPLNFDPVEWSHILYNVTKRGQELYGDHLQRMRNKPANSLSFSPEPIMESFTQLTTRIFSDPSAFTDAQVAIWQHYIDITKSTLQRLQGFAAGTPIAPPPKIADKRFQSKEWQVNWMFDFMRQTYQTTTEEMQRLVKAESADVESKLAQKMEFFTRLIMDATAPSNFWLTNPEVLRETWNTHGENLIRGFKNYLEDVERGNGVLRMRMSDYQAFQIGKNIGATPGKVVYQNELMQLIQYSPSTETVKAVPLLIMPPWINKFYILDLKEKNSYLRYAVQQGYTVFVISWVNPTKEHAHINFEDYIRLGSLAAMREIKRITGMDQINTAAYCVGGTMQACTLAMLAKMKNNYPADLPKVQSATFLTSLVDFEHPGDLGVFIDEEQISMLEKRMEKQGYLDAVSLMMTFNLLRSSELFWPFFINNYLLGREPFPFDILYWNTDSTNLPAAMHSYYLRRMYLENKLIEPNALTMCGVPIDLTQIETPCFLLSTREDHIAPWKSTYAATQLYSGPVTFVLAGSGHIAGVVNPPTPGKYSYCTNSQLPSDPEEWLKGSEEHKGSWWPHWVEWLNQYAGEAVPARAVGEGIEDAPGSYVKAIAL